MAAGYTYACGRRPPRRRTAILWESSLSFFAFPPWMAFIARACPSTKAMPSAAHRSASQYHVNMHSAATTRSSRYGATISRNAAGVVFTLRCTQHLAGRVEDADVHGLHVQIRSAIVTVLPVVESHRTSSCAAASKPCASLLV